MSKEEWFITTLHTKKACLRLRKAAVVTPRLLQGMQKFCFRRTNSWNNLRGNLKSPTSERRKRLLQESPTLLCGPKTKTRYPRSLFTAERDPGAKGRSAVLHCISTQIFPLMITDPPLSKWMRWWVQGVHDVPKKNLSWGQYSCGWIPSR